MTRFLTQWLAIGLMLASSCVCATTVTIHTEDAQAMLDALQDPSLTHEQALKVVQMHGNQAIIRNTVPATPCWKAHLER